MAETYDPLYFEFEDSIPTSPITKKKKKLIGLDDLLEDYQKEQKKLYEKTSKRTKTRKVSEAKDKFDDATEARLSECVDKCQKEMNQVIGDDELPFWGIQVFGDQEKFLKPECPDQKSCILLQSFINHEISSLVELNIEKGENFLEGLLMDGWLLNLVYTCGSVERSIATWIFNLSECNVIWNLYNALSHLVKLVLYASSVLYSSKETLTTAACEFWCTILITKDKADVCRIKVDWLPRYLDLKRALENYGFLLDSPPTSSSDVDMVSNGSGTAGPPQNIRSWIKCATVCCQTRNTFSIFSTPEAEELLFIIISFFLDRRLLGLSGMLHECMLSGLYFFRDEEWHSCCNKIAKSIVCRLPRDVNCLRVVESIAGVDTRCKQLRSVVAFQFLVAFLDGKVSDAEEILRLLISINIKDKNCDLFRMYICLNLAENWLFLDPSCKNNKSIQQLWGICLRNCSCGITITDLRSYASNVRIKASYLIQGTAK